ncbi:MAG: acyl-CoA/acyl-ACP dehydrogenase [Immundisolibacteraceae bacterium]|nr:acyl-CoA/acyl-ACP dehydrogenase [Immundisolibacteraceae bacterium]
MSNSGNSAAIESALADFLAQFGRRLSQLSGGVAGIDQFQVETRQLAQLATDLEAARSLQSYADSHPEVGQVQQQLAAQLCWLETLMIAREAGDRFHLTLQLGNETAVSGQSMTEALRGFDSQAAYRQLGNELIEQGTNPEPFLIDEDPLLKDLVTTTRRFADQQVLPHAQQIHCEDLLVPESIIAGMAELGLFGASIPEQYGGVGLGNLPMILITEQLSMASLPAAGSLITRPEVLAKALLAGGSDQQKQQWLPLVANGELMVAVAVTEPDTGSDVANIRCRATRGEVDGQPGWLIDGSKAWCTFAGRANLLALLVRTNSDASQGHRGLSLMIVEKEVFDGHEFLMQQPAGGRLTGKADDTMGYRGMHSFTLQFESYFVPADNLIGGDEGIGKGFYFQMAGFAAGRLQTGGRAVGLGQASLQAGLDYCQQRKQFGEPLANFQNSQYQLGRMSVQLQAARQLTYRAAREMDRAAADDSNPAAQKSAELLAAMAKLRSCRMAVDISQAAQLLHGGWGYAQEFPIARFVADALVLPIFEGVEPILEMKVIGRQLLAGIAANSAA